jgi:GrpB-like predicted nucleotidyltransferase (UPF0157 family)
MIEIPPYRPAWRDEFTVLGKQLRQHLGDLALRIDHIGSTSVPGLAAKDIIDIQITVRSLTPDVEAALNRAGYQRVLRITSDHLPPGDDSDPRQWYKWIFKPLPDRRRAHVHVRMEGRANQRYALLFLDYLRAFPDVAKAYALVKCALARHHPEEDMGVYYEVKDPVCDIIIGGAELWASNVDWQAGITDC